MWRADDTVTDSNSGLATGLATEVPAALQSEQKAEGVGETEQAELQRLTVRTAQQVMTIPRMVIAVYLL